MAEDELANGLSRLRAELESGQWDRKYGHLRTLTELDLGHRLLVAELPGPSGEFPARGAD